MRWVGFIVLFIINFNSLAQGMKVGVVIAPTLRNLYIKNETLFKKPWANINGKEYALLGWDFGLSIEKPISPKWSLASGVYFSLKGFQHGPVNSLKPFSNERSATTYVNYHFEFLEAPLLIKYTFVSYAKFQLYGSVGVSAAWLISDYRTLDVRWGELTEPQADALLMDWDGQNYYYRDFNIGLWVGLGISKSLSRYLEVSAEPLLKFFLKDVNYLDSDLRLNLPDRRYLYSFGLNIGLHYKFIKRKIQKRPL